MVPKRFLKKLAKYIRKCVRKFLRNSSQIAPISFNAIDAIDALGAIWLDNHKSQQSSLELTEAEIYDNMDQSEARKLANRAVAIAAVATFNANDLKPHPCHSFDLIAMPSIELHSIPKRTRFFDQMISKFSRYPLDKLIIIKSFSCDDDTNLIGLSFENANAVMIVYENHPLIKQIAGSLMKTSKEVEFRWLNLREIEILKNY